MKGRGARRRALLGLVLAALGIGLIFALRHDRTSPRSDRAERSGPEREWPDPFRGTGSDAAGATGAAPAGPGAEPGKPPVFDRAVFRLLTPEGELAAGARAKLTRQPDPNDFKLEALTEVVMADGRGIVRLPHPATGRRNAYLEAAWLLPDDDGVHSGLWPLANIAVVDGVQQVRFERGGSLTVRAEGLAPDASVPVQLVFFASSTKFSELFEPGEIRHFYGPKGLRGTGSWMGLRTTVKPGEAAVFPALSTSYVHLLRVTAPEGHYLIASAYTGRRIRGRGHNPVFRVTEGVDETLTLVFRQLPEIVIELDPSGGMPPAADVICGFSFWNRPRLAGRRSGSFDDGIARIRMASPGPNVTTDQLRQSRYVAIVRAKGFATRLLTLDYELGTKEVRRTVRLKPAADAQPLVVRGRVETNTGLPVAFLNLRMTDANFLSPIDVRTGADGAWQATVARADAPLYRWGRTLHVQRVTGAEHAKEVRIGGKPALVRRLGEWESKIPVDARAVDVLLRVERLKQPGGH